MCVYYLSLISSLQALHYSAELSAMSVDGCFLTLVSKTVHGSMVHVSRVTNLPEASITTWTSESQQRAENLTAEAGWIGESSALEWLY